MIVLDDERMIETRRYRLIQLINTHTQISVGP